MSKKSLILDIGVARSQVAALTLHSEELERKYISLYVKDECDCGRWDGDDFTDAECTGECL